MVLAGGMGPTGGQAVIVAAPIGEAGERVLPGEGCEVGVGAGEILTGGAFQQSEAVAAALLSFVVPVAEQDAEGGERPHQRMLGCGSAGEARHATRWLP